MGHTKLPLASQETGEHPITRLAKLDAGYVLTVARSQYAPIFIQSILWNTKLSASCTLPTYNRLPAGLLSSRSKVM